jgi:SAM-dependent methyltransferase
MYRADPEREWQRTVRHRMEFAVSLRALDEHLPPAPARVLDCGGGPGRYAIALSKRGYEVTLFDLSPELLALARRRTAEAGVALSAFEQGSATDLSRFADDHFDAVLLMGPLYHLLEERDRRRALVEAYRVVKPGGPVFAAFIARYAGHLDAAAHYPARAAEMPEAYRSIVEIGHEPLPEEGKISFVGYFAHPDEVVPLCRSAGFEVETLLGVEGVTASREAKVNELTGEAWDFWVDVNYELARDPSLHGGVEHLLAICRKPRWRAVLRRLVLALAEAGIDVRIVGGAALALRGLPVEVNDLDLEMTEEDAYRCQALIAAHQALNADVVEPVAWRETATIRSHFGRFVIDGVPVEVIGALERRAGDRWVRTFGATRTTVDLDGVPIPVLELEEETLAYLRRGRLDRAAVAMPTCNPDRFTALLRDAQARGLF